MHPVIEIGPVSLLTYPCLVGTGVVIGGLASMLLAIADRLPFRRVPLMIIGAVLAGMFGARFLHVIVVWEQYQHRPWMAFAFWDGWAFIGGPILGLVYLIVYSRLVHLPTWKVLDCVGPGVVIGLAVGRIGCCAAGCCHGYPTDCPLGMSFVEGIDPPQWHGIPLHPTQLYEAAGLVVLFGGMLWLFGRRGFDGQVCLAFCAGYPLLRFPLEFLRGDVTRGFVVGWLSTSQFISLVSFALALTIWLIRLRQSRRGGSVFTPAEQERAPRLADSSPRLEGSLPHPRAA